MIVCTFLIRRKSFAVLHLHRLKFSNISAIFRRRSFAVREKRETFPVLGNGYFKRTSLDIVPRKSLKAITNI